MDLKRNESPISITLKGIQAWRDHKPNRPFSSSKATANRNVGLLGPYAEEHPFRNKQAKSRRPISNYHQQNRFRSNAQSLGITFNF